jgi:DNA-binding MarR family transcriptional regulator
MVVKADRPANPADLDLGRLALCLGRRVDELVAEQLASAGFAGMRQSHVFLIQHLIGEDRTVTELARLMGVTQQAASKSVAEMVRIGLLDPVEGGDRRARRVRLSERGRALVRCTRRIRSRIDARLVRRLGAAAYRAARTTLLACVDGLGQIPIS